jgi:hypothetical protein
MRVPSGSYWQRSIRFILLFICGMLTGMCTFLLLFGQELDRLQIRIRELEKQNVQYVQDIIEYKKLENQIIQREKKEVKNIEIHLLQLKDKFVEEELEKRLSKDLYFLKGKPLEYVTGFHEGIGMMIAERKYIIDKRTYMLHLSTLVISSTLHLYIKAEENM